MARIGWGLAMTRQRDASPGGQGLVSDTVAHETPVGPSVPSVSTGMADPAGEPPPTPTNGKRAASQEFTAEELRAISAKVRAEFPRPINRPVLVLMDVDPHRLHAFWTVNLGAMREARQRLGIGDDPAQLVLRVHETAQDDGGSSATAKPFDVEVQGLSGSTGVDIWGDGRSYFAEMGLRSADGRLSLISRSETVVLPPTGPAAMGTYREVTVAEDGGGSAPVAAPEPSPSPEHRHAAESPPSGGRLPPPEESDFPLPPDPWGAGAGDPGGHAEGHGAEGAGAEGQGGGAASSGGAESLSPEGAGSEGIISEVVSQESVVSLSSFAFGKENVEFEVNAELHIFGRARPGRELTLFGRRVSVRPDGTFSIRRPLPNGALVVSALLAGGFQEDDG